jgi:hypothetical protein
MRLDHPGLETKKAEQANGLLTALHWQRSAEKMREKNVETNAHRQKEVIEGYIAAYNAFDIEAMLAFILRMSCSRTLWG